jgi:hypothetical protein
MRGGRALMKREASTSSILEPKRTKTVLILKHCILNMGREICHTTSAPKKSVHLGNEDLQVMKDVKCVDLKDRQVEDQEQKEGVMPMCQHKLERCKATGKREINCECLEERN